MVVLPLVACSPCGPGLAELALAAAHLLAEVLAATGQEVVPDGVDTGLFRPIHDREALSRWRTMMFGADIPCITYVGKPTERRNLSALIRAFAELKAKEHLPHKLLIVGADLPGTSPYPISLLS